MAQQILNVSTPNSGLGDALRDASIKSNDNFTELYEGKVDKVTGKDLSDNNLTDELVTKINDLEANAQVNIQSDWNENDIEADAYIKNKPEQLFSSLGYFDYADLATQTTPITVAPDTETLLTNDTLGDDTNTSQPPYGVSAIWDADSDEFNFQQLSVGDTVDIRVHLKTTTTTANQKYHVDMKFAFDGPSEFENRIFSQVVKTSGEDEQTFISTLYIGSEDVKNYPARLYITSDDDATVKVVGWFCRVFRKSVNIVDLEDPINLISTDPDNAIELGTDGKLWSVEPIPLTGTEVGKPITGSLELDVASGDKIFFADYGDKISRILFSDDGFIRINVIANDGTKATDLSLNVDGFVFSCLLDSDQVTFASDITNNQILLSGNASCKGITASTDFSDNYDDLSYVQKVYSDGLRGKFISKTTTEINAISSPQAGETYFNSTLGTLCFYDGSDWQKVSFTSM